MFNKLKSKLKDITANGLPVTLSAGIIEQLIRKNSDMPDVKVEITPEYLILSGTTEVKKMMLKKNIPFIVVLKPIQLEKRTILFELVKVKPIDMNFINTKVFNKSPFSDYTERTIKVDLNAWEIVRGIPVGNIKTYQLVEDALIITMSL